MRIYNTAGLQKCNDPRGLGCFALVKDGRCKCLKDTKQVPCPFFKTVGQVKEECPNYFERSFEDNG